MIAPPSHPASPDHGLSKKKFFADVGYNPHRGQELIHAATMDPLTWAVIVSCGARFGKTLAAAHEMAWEAVQPRFPSEKNPNAEFMGWCVAPTHDLADIVFDTVAIILRRWLKGNVSVNKTDGKIEITNLGGTRSRIMRRSTDQAAGKAKLVGYAVDFMVIDEASGIKDADIWESQLRTRLIDRKGRVLMISTPRGVRGFFADLHRAGRQGEKGIVSIKLPTWINPHVDPAVIHREKLGMPDRFFRQDYGAEFIAEGGLVFQPEFVERISIAKFEPALEDEVYYAGLDLAITQDYTVLMIFKRPKEPGEPPRVVFMERFFRMQIEEQIDRVAARLAEYNNAQCAVDETGVGKPICQLMTARGLYIRPIYWTVQTKGDMVRNCVALVEQGNLLLPEPDLAPQLYEELDCYGWHTTPSGHVTSMAPSGSHDDCIAALIMGAFWFHASGPSMRGRSWTKKKAQRKATGKDKRAVPPEEYAAGEALPAANRAQEHRSWSPRRRRSGRMWKHSLLG